MAYISTDQIKEIRKELKGTLTTKDGFKLSIRREHYSTICIVVKKSPLAFSSNDKRINDFYIDRLEDKNERTVFGIINKVVNRHAGACNDRNAGDIGADYANFPYFKNFSIELN
ncbi:MAG: hypothetical protein JKY43_03260 [Phycisphaerales bacterium]|nr:hypothetical protein [Phycisphaerales bacterium]